MKSYRKISSICANRKCCPVAVRTPALYPFPLPRRTFFLDMQSHLFTLTLTSIFLPFSSLSSISKDPFPYESLTPFHTYVKEATSLWLDTTIHEWRLWSKWHRFMIAWGSRGNPTSTSPLPALNDTWLNVDTCHVCSVNPFPIIFYAISPFHPNTHTQTLRKTIKRPEE